MQSYLNTLEQIVNHGALKQGRNGPTRAIFGTSTRYDLREGFPLLTTKKINFKNIVEELVWFISGDTNNETLRERGVNIWNKWAMPVDKSRRRFTDQKDWENWFHRTLHNALSNSIVKAQLEASTMGEEEKKTLDEVIELYRKAIVVSEELGYEQAWNVLKDSGVLKHNQSHWTEQFPAVGELGPVYGKMWRFWPDGNGGHIDQLANAITMLKERPDSRRIYVTAWNPALIPDESKSHVDNIIDGKQVLPPCHVSYQFYSHVMTLAERVKHAGHVFMIGDTLVGPNFDFDQNTDPVFDEQVMQVLDAKGVPTRWLSCRLDQRSADWPVGVPYNIASYSLLTMVVAKIVGMAPYEFYHTTGDTHVYGDQVELAKEQITRIPTKLPKVLINPYLTDIDKFCADDVRLVDYQCQAHIPYPVTD